MVVEFLNFVTRQDVLNALALGASLAGQTLTMGALRWERRVGLRKDERSIRTGLTEQYYNKRPTVELYGIAPLLKLDHEEIDFDKSIVDRAQKISSLDDKTQEKLYDLANRWIDTIGKFAVQASWVYKLPLKPFLRTYHLGVIREGMIMLPILIHMLVHHKIKGGSMRMYYMLWGIALVRQAIRYNDISRFQRKDVFITVGEKDDQWRLLGPVLRYHKKNMLWRNFQHKCLVYFSLRWWHISKTRRWVNKLQDQMKEAGK